ncbi:hypothetical protein L596_009950 [Steinernema carpocapsae]|uniref:Uncharacterized protein n=1 Tax=Steinernema carpocapsae TaxID=34508 RepID=A0A4V6A6W0_STECR|nr:hypothetical protein L596_009950 [Steinernema carpocapsae]
MAKVALDTNSKVKTSQVCIIFCLSFLCFNGIALAFWNLHGLNYQQDVPINGSYLIAMFYYIFTALALMVKRPSTVIIANFVLFELLLAVLCLLATATGTIVLLIEGISALVTGCNVYNYKVPLLGTFATLVFGCVHLATMKCFYRYYKMLVEKEKKRDGFIRMIVAKSGCVEAEKKLAQDDF